MASNQSVRMNLNVDGREKIKVEVNSSLRGQGLNMQMGKKMWLCKRDLVQLDRDMGHNSSNNNIEVRALGGWSVGHVVRNTLGEIVHNIRMEGLRYTVHKRQTVGDVGQSIPRIYATMDNGQAEQHAYIIEMDGKLCDQVISILIDLGSNYSYVSPDLVDNCGLNKELHVESWFVQLATGTKKLVHHWVIACAFDLNGMPTTTQLNVLPLGSYNMLLGMDWLYLNRTKVDCYDKAI